MKLTICAALLASANGLVQFPPLMKAGLKSAGNNIAPRTCNGGNGNNGRIGGWGGGGGGGDGDGRDGHGDGEGDAFLYGTAVLGLVVKTGRDGETYLATRDGGAGSASFTGSAPKGGKQLKEASHSAKDAAKKFESKVEETFHFKDALGKAEDKASKATDKAEKKLDDKRVGPFWESRLFKEGGLGFVFGAGTALALKKSSQANAVAVSATCVIAQYLSRSGYWGCGGKLGWPQLDAWKLAKSERARFGGLWRSARLFKYTVQESLPTAEGYLAGLTLGLTVS